MLSVWAFVCSTFLKFSFLSSKQSHGWEEKIALWKKFAIVWWDAQKCKPDCSFTSFWYMRWFTSFEEKSSFYACKCSCLLSEWWVEKNRLHYLFTIMSLLSLQRQTPSGLLWVGTLPLWNIRQPPWPQKPHLIISRTCIQMQAFADCALLHLAMLPGPTVVHDDALISKLTDYATWWRR